MGLKPALECAGKAPEEVFYGAAAHHVGEAHLREVGRSSSGGSRRQLLPSRPAHCADGDLQQWGRVNGQC